MAKKKEAKKKVKKKKKAKKKPISSKIHETFDFAYFGYEEAIDIWFEMFFEELEELIFDDVSPKKWRFIEKTLLEHLTISIEEVVIRPFALDEYISIKLKIQGRKSDIKQVNKVLEARHDIAEQENAKAQQKT